MRARMGMFVQNNQCLPNAGSTRKRHTAGKIRVQNMRLGTVRGYAPATLPAAKRKSTVVQRVVL